MKNTIIVTTPAADINLVSLYEAKVQLKLTDDGSDDLVEMLVRQASDEIAAYCNRTFARESVVETFTDLRSDVSQLYLSRFPVASIDSVNAAGTDITDYTLESNTGLLLPGSNGAWAEPIIVTYTGGYDLPFDAPPALRKASTLLIREAYYAAVRGDATVRMLSHKESRIIYFDPNLIAARAAGGAGVAAAGSAAQRAAHNLLVHFTRYVA
jgi:hypothetical protein